MSRGSRRKRKLARAGILRDSLTPESYIERVMRDTQWLMIDEYRRWQPTALERAMESRPRTVRADLVMHHAYDIRPGFPSLFDQHLGTMARAAWPAEPERVLRLPAPGMEPILEVVR